MAEEVGNARRRPNILFIITDQQRADHTGFGGNPVLETPHLDSIATSGTVFDRAFVANPVCMPNRSTIVTGRMPSRHGVRFNGIPLEWGVNTFVRVMRENGYWTGLVGKSHLQNMGHLPGAGDMMFGKKESARATNYPEGWDDYENLERHRRELVEFPPDFYGFDHVDLVTDHSDKAGGHYHQWLISQGVDRTKLDGPENALQRYDGYSEIYQTAMPVELYPTSYVTGHAVEQIEAATKAGQPFFIHVGYPDPHHPFAPPGEYYERYSPDEMVLPRTFQDPDEPTMAHMKMLAKRRGSPHPVIKPAMWAPSEEQLRESMAREFGSIAMIDDGVGELLASLERLGIADETIVVFTSDHGDMFGDHGLLLKGATHYEGCTRIPLIIADPDRGSARSEALVGSIDLARTMLDLCGLAEYHGMEGESLVGLLDDPASEGHGQLLIEEDEMIDVFGTGRYLRMRTLVTDEGRITVYAGSEMGELYDHRVDPDELENRWDDPDASVFRAEMIERLAREVIDADDETIPTHFA